MSVVRNENGAQYSRRDLQRKSHCMRSIAYTTAMLGSATQVRAFIGTTGTAASFINQSNSLGTALNTVGASINYVNNQVSYNSDKVDALNCGLGSLVDADLAKESAQLQALQIRQQLGTQALSLANQAPQTLLSLFK